MYLPAVITYLNRGRQRPPVLLGELRLGVLGDVESKIQGVGTNRSLPSNASALEGDRTRCYQGSDGRKDPKVAEKPIPAMTGNDIRWRIAVTNLHLF